jgi:hypothetical protein
MAPEYFYSKNSQLTHEKVCQLMPFYPPPPRNDTVSAGYVIIRFAPSGNASGIVIANNEAIRKYLVHTYKSLVPKDKPLVSGDESLADVPQPFGDIPQSLGDICLSLKKVDSQKS